MNDKPDDSVPNISLRHEYKIPRAAREVKDELLKGKTPPQDKEPKSAKIMRFM